MQLADSAMLEPFAWSPVLIVDDDQASALLALKLLLRSGLRSVDTINDARLVVDWVEEHDPDLVLLDLHMPFLDGYAVLAALRERASSTELPVIVLTADDTMGASTRALELGANDFLLKPLQPVELNHRVRNLLDMRAAHRSLQRRQRWLEEAERFSRELFSGEVERPVMTMATRAMALADADHVLVMQPAEQGHQDGVPTPFHCVGASQSGPTEDLTIDLDERLCAQLAGHATPVLIEDAKEDPGVSVSAGESVDIGPMMLLPIRMADTTRAAVALLRERGREPYGPSDLETAHQFVTRAAIALELVDRRTEQKRYLDFFEILVSQVAEYAILRLDVDGTIASWNVGAERVLGYRAEDAIGRHFSLLHPEEDLRDGTLDRLLDRARGTGRAQHQGWGVRSDGTRFWGEVSVNALRDHHGALIGYAKLTRDLTESKRLELARESFFAALSHDLRTPLNSIQGFVELIPIVDDERRGEYINRVHSNVGRLTVLIDNLLDHARVRAGALPINPQVLYAPGVAAACVRDLAPLLSGHEVMVGRSELTVYADQQILGRVLANLLVNATRYSPDGSPIEIRFEQYADSGRIIVSDHGRGIAPEDLETIFDEFERGTLAEADGGTGLGLSSVRQLVALQRGDVWIDSELGVGTTVTVELPLGPPSDKASDVPASEAVQEDGPQA
ncbi:ATP-binding protein [Nocardioides pocheonensis]|uniref:histidine kinase n=1 Tax=Nocardioides pocheonensis TaxID=661485 RepID=A0A3N0GPE1_9ACTN|nr:ATP-binding protein [Nocardioides pocheonensis]RNM14018.1 response regulator [Nocardioides pocheonensis]